MKKKDVEIFLMKKRMCDIEYSSTLNICEVDSIVELFKYVKIFLINFKIPFYLFFAYFFNNLFAFGLHNYIVYIDKKPIGIFGLYEEDDKLWLQNFCVNKGYRNKGIATEMLSFIFSVYFEFEYLYLKVKQGNENAINLYRKSGFEIIDFCVESG